MANVTFSKNGVPMGRNKSTDENNHSRWTADEDNYIRTACAQNVTARVIAAKLGRSAASVHSRKWTLGIKNDTSVRRKNLPKTPKTNYTSEYKAPKGLELFKLESGVPVPSRGGRNEKDRQQIRSILERMQVGQSFVVPKGMVHVATYIANKEFQAYKLRTSATDSDKKFYRIFRLV